MKEEITFLSSSGGWIDSLLWCPSQCYYVFSLNDVVYTIYLRWRHDDPWTVSLIQGDLTNDFSDFEWLFDIDSPYGENDGLQDLKEWAIQQVIEYLNKDTRDVAE